LTKNALLVCWSAAGGTQTADPNVSDIAPKIDAKLTWLRVIFMAAQLPKN
jgi:hypothetical protein